jgi:hypothetical protein
MGHTDNGLVDCSSGPMHSLSRADAFSLAGRCILSRGPMHSLSRADAFSLGGRCILSRSVLSDPATQNSLLSRDLSYLPYTYLTPIFHLFYTCLIPVLHLIYTCFAPALHLLYTCFAPAIHLLYTCFPTGAVGSVNRDPPRHAHPPLQPGACSPPSSPARSRGHARQVTLDLASPARSETASESLVCLSESSTVYLSSQVTVYRIPRRDRGPSSPARPSHARPRSPAPLALSHDSFGSLEPPPPVKQALKQV